MNQRQMLEWVMMLGFCAFDMQLYLDTHPCDREALAYYRECVDMYKKAKERHLDLCRHLHLRMKKAGHGQKCRYHGKE